jgi:hypothetical protein
MLDIIQLFSGEDVSWRKSARGAIAMGKSIKPENCIGYQANDNQPWYAFERERVVATTSRPTVFDSANEAFDFGNMLILRTEVELNVSNDCL